MLVFLSRDCSCLLLSGSHCSAITIKQKKKTTPTHTKNNVNKLTQNKKI